MLNFLDYLICKLLESDKIQNKLILANEHHLLNLNLDKINVAQLGSIYLLSKWLGTYFRRFFKKLTVGTSVPYSNLALKLEKITQHLLCLNLGSKFHLDS